MRGLEIDSFNLIILRISYLKYCSRIYNITFKLEEDKDL